MFQYALGRRLAHDRGVPLKLDLSWFCDAERGSVDTVRHFALDGWRIKASIANADDLARFPARQGLLARLGLVSPIVMSERGLGFNLNVLRAPATAHLTGYWQSEKYFNPIRELLLEEFMPVAPTCPHAAALLPQVLVQNTVAVHVRRGDYAENPRTNAFHGVCPIEYYRDAVNRIAQQFLTPSFFVFSDDPDWVRNHLKLDQPTTIVWHDGGCSPLQDIWLMRQCSHHIIANSSFSWWGAWLCQYGNKVVIAPKRWYTDAKYETGDLIPETWTRI
jgi:hypothetical protein